MGELLHSCGAAGNFRVQVFLAAKTADIWTTQHKESRFKAGNWKAFACVLDPELKESIVCEDGVLPALSNRVHQFGISSFVSPDHKAVACAAMRGADWTGLGSLPCTSMVVPSINQLSREFLQALVHRTACRISCVCTSFHMRTTLQDVELPLLWVADFPNTVRGEKQL